MKYNNEKTDEKEDDDKEKKNNDKEKEDNEKKKDDESEFNKNELVKAKWAKSTYELTLYGEDGNTLITNVGTDKPWNLKNWGWINEIFQKELEKFNLNYFTVFYFHLSFIQGIIYYIHKILETAESDSAPAAPAAPASASNDADALCCSCCSCFCF